MTSDRAGGHGSGSSGGRFQSVKIVLITNLQTESVRDLMPFFFFFGEWNVLFLFDLKNLKFFGV